MVLSHFMGAKLYKVFKSGNFCGMGMIRSCCYLPCSHAILVFCPMDNPCGGRSQDPSGMSEQARADDSDALKITADDDRSDELEATTFHVFGYSIR